MNQSGSLLIPEINFEAPTPKVHSPCISPKGHEKYLPLAPKRELVIKYSEDLEKEEEVAKAEVKGRTTIFKLQGVSKNAS